MSNAELSFQFAKEIATQLITLSSALIGVSVTFLKDFRSDRLTPLRISWGLYIATIICGIWTLMTLTGTLEGLAASGKTFTGFAGSTRRPWFRSSASSRPRSLSSCSAGRMRWNGMRAVPRRQRRAILRQGRPRRPARHRRLQCLHKRRPPNSGAGLLGHSTPTPILPTARN